MLSYSRTAIRSWAVMGLVLLVVLAAQAYQGFDQALAAETRETPHVITILGEGRRTIQEGEFHGAHVMAVMGHYELNLHDATIRPGSEVIVDVLSVMGGITIRVPDGWTVDTRAVPVLGGVSDKRFRTLPAPGDQNSRLNRDPAPRLILRGVVVMGGLIIKS